MKFAIKIDQAWMHYKYISIQFHRNFIEISLKFQLQFISNSLKMHLNFISISFQFHWNWIEIGLKFHWNFNCTQTLSTSPSRLSKVTERPQSHAQCALILRAAHAQKPTKKFKKSRRVCNVPGLPRTFRGPHSLHGWSYHWVWSTRGGGFYHRQAHTSRRLGAPQRIPRWRMIDAGPPA